MLQKHVIGTSERNLFEKVVDIEEILHSVH